MAWILGFIRSCIGQIKSTRRQNIQLKKLKTLVIGEATRLIQQQTNYYLIVFELIFEATYGKGERLTITQTILQRSGVEGAIVTLGVAVESFGTFVLTVVFDKLSSDIIQHIARHTKGIWNLAKIFELLNEELKARETVNVDCKNVDLD